MVMVRVHVRHWPTTRGLRNNNNCPNERFLHINETEEKKTKTKNEFLAADFLSVHSNIQMAFRFLYSISTAIRFLCVAIDFD